MTTRTDLDPARLGVPDDPIPLPPGHLACLSCGVAVHVAASAQAPIAAEATGRDGQPPRAPRPEGSPTYLLRTEFLRCPACLARHEHAASLLDAHLRVRARLGNGTALHLVECALHALAVLDHDLSTELPEPTLLSLLRHLSAPGSMARWLMRFAPVQAADAMPGTCNPYPWAHLRGGLRLHLREGYAAVLSERVASSAPPVDLPPPGPLAGCLMCGLGSVRVPAIEVARAGGREAATRQVWTGKRVSPAAFGGQPSPEPLAGDLCPQCSDAAEHAGALGPSAVGRAFLAHLRATGRGDEAKRLQSGELVGLIGWGALAYAAHRRGGAPAPANREPWGHIGTGYDA